MEHPSHALPLGIMAFTVKEKGAVGDGAEPDFFGAFAGALAAVNFYCF